MSSFRLAAAAAPALLLLAAVAAQPARASTEITGFGSDFTLNSNTYAAASGSPAISPDGSTLDLTNDGRNDTRYDPPAGSEATSAFDTNLQAVSTFTAQFTYQESNDGSELSPADGFAFVIQDDSRGASALGDGSQEFGYGTASDVTAISPSAAVEFNIYNGRTLGTNFYTDGVSGADSGAADFNPTSPLELDSGDPIQVLITYDGTTLTEDLTDATAGTSYSASYATDLASVLGSNMAYIGFSGGTGGGVADQDISNFTFVGNASAAPEPSQVGIIALLGLGVGGLLLRARRRAVPQ